MIPALSEIFRQSQLLSVRIPNRKSEFFGIPNFRIPIDTTSSDAQMASASTFARNVMGSTTVLGEKMSVIVRSNVELESSAAMVVATTTGVAATAGEIAAMARTRGAAAIQETVAWGNSVAWMIAAA